MALLQSRPVRRADHVCPRSARQVIKPLLPGPRDFRDPVDWVL